MGLELVRFRSFVGTLQYKRHVWCKVKGIFIQEAKGTEQEAIAGPSVLFWGSTQSAGHLLSLVVFG
jgi:septal ring factor EnvC (AmiA/AmiB activator)